MPEPMSEERLAHLAALAALPCSCGKTDCPSWTSVLSMNETLELLAEVERLRAIIARVTDQMRQYDRHGSGMVNIRQVLNLLSPTWPDGNYEAAPEDGDRG